MFCDSAPFAGYASHMSTRQTVSTVLREAILQSGRSLRDIGGATGVDGGRLSRFCRGERGLTTDAVDALAAELGLTLTPQTRRRKRS